jgi:glycosyltransferase involved in cell wall biosynthesis
MKPRIVFVASAHETLAAFFGRQLQYLAAHGFEVHAVSSPGAGLEELRARAEIAVHALPIERKPDPLRDLVSLYRLCRLIRRLRPAIVHAHTPKAGLLGMLASALAGVRVRLYTVHGLPLMTRSGWLRRLLECAERTTCALSTRTYCISPSLEEVVRQSRLCRGGKLSTPGFGSCSGIDLRRFNPQEDVPGRRRRMRRELAIPQDATVILVAGRIARDKGIETLAAAWPALAAEFPGLHLLLCGACDPTDPVPPAVLDALRGDARVHITAGWVVDMPSIYAGTDIAILPTLREGLSQVALECGAMQLPVVGTCIPGLVNAVSDNETALLVPPADPPALAHAVRRLVNDPALCRSLGRAGREFVEARFSEGRVNSLYLSEYQVLCTTELCS